MQSSGFASIARRHRSNTSPAVTPKMTTSDEPTLFSAVPQEPAISALTVSQVTALVKRAIREHLPARVHVVGEVSNFKRHGSGHLYFTLKDDASELSCVMWRSAATRLKFEPQDGMAALTTGEIDVFQRAGRYQLYVRRLEPTGVGQFELALRQRSDKLRREGLFEPATKKPLPPYPTHIAVVTSPTGAAIRDILFTIQRRYPCVLSSVYPVTVQGDKAVAEITAALDRLDQQKAQLGVDLIILGRGGGSLEDLWAFNEEAVARAIFRCRIPIISAVGHEIDVTISDLVADVRAATPTAAAELAVPDRQEILKELQRRRQRLEQSTIQRLMASRSAIEAMAQREPFRRPQLMVRQQVEFLDQLHTSLDRAVQYRLQHRAQRLAKMEVGLQTIEPKHAIASRQNRLRTLAERARIVIQRRLQHLERSLHNFDTRLARNSPEHRVRLCTQRVDSVWRSLRIGLTELLRQQGRRLGALEKRLLSVDYRRTLARGYSVTRQVATAELMTTAAAAKPGDVIETETFDGSFESTVNERLRRQTELFE